MQFIIYHIVNGNQYVDKIVLSQTLVKNINLVWIYSNKFVMGMLLSYVINLAVQ